MSKFLFLLCMSLERIMDYILCMSPPWDNNVNGGPSYCVDTFIIVVNPYFSPKVNNLVLLTFQNSLYLRE